MTVTLHQLLKASVPRKTPCKTFLSLFNQLDQKSPISENEFISNLVDNLEGLKTKTKILLDYSLTIAFSSEKRLTEFWTNFIKLSSSLQTQYLKKVSEYLPHGPTHTVKKVSKELLKSFINVHLMKYTNTILDRKDASDKDVVNHLVMLWCLIIQRDIYIEQFDNLGSHIIHSLYEMKQESLLKYFVKVSKIRGDEDFSISGEGIEATSSSVVGLEREIGKGRGIQTISRLFNSPQSVKNYPKLVQIKKSIWIYSIISKFLCISTSDFVKTFESKFFLKNNLQEKKGYALLTSIITSLFEGIIPSTSSSASYPSYVVANWKNFIVTKLVSICREVELTKLEIEEVIQTAMKQLPTSYSDLQLKQNFVKSCIFNSVLDMSSFNKIFPNDPPTVSLNSELHQFKNNTINGSIADDFSKKLIDINSEFISLEESGLIQYVSSLSKQFQFCLAKQRELNTIVNKLVDDFIRNKNNEKLNRLLLSLLNEPATLSMIFFEKDPVPFLSKLIKYIDQSEIDQQIRKTNSSNDVSDGNSGVSDDFQEIYSQFGVILLSIIQFIEYFDINSHNDLLLIKKSFTMDYLNNFHYRLCDQLTSNLNMKSIGGEDIEDDQTIITNYNSLVGDWIRSLFDETNEDGLSDELIKQVNVKQLYKIIPLIYQQAIIAFNCGKIDIKTLNNGLDYLTQLLLIPCSLSIINWLLRYIIVGNGKLVQVLHTIIKSSMKGGSTKNNEEGVAGDDNNGNSEISDQVLVFKLVLNSCSKDILATLSQIAKTPESEEIISIIEANIDQAFITPSQSTKIANERIIKSNPIVSFRTYLRELIEAPINSPVILNQWLFEYILQFEQNALMSFLYDEIHMNYNRANSEESILLFNIIIFMLNDKYILNEEDKKFWERKIKVAHHATSTIGKFNKNDNKENNENRNEVTEKSLPESEQVVPGKKSFSTTMSYHYSSIFNIPEEDNLEDDLFNEHMNFDDNSNITNPSGSVMNSIISVKETMFRKTSFLAELLRVKNQIDDDSLNVFIERIVDF
ncbi:mediator of RNA polymerase II transcription subunit 5 [[Candida] railenensis]|uniref:Mediator of RNA polymerase II transcription subunit 5 n=1 Tax=[Candida] railenensis TaxID=45579 RepID=A0A9P0QNI6_9ASCO|nr:mediator of RNA polymerase II transcription subunit 5 [[Candida] railenensis]